MKKILLTLACGLFFQIAAWAQPSAILVAPEGEAPCTGEEVCIPVTIKDFTNILASSFDIQWDPEVLQYQGVGAINGMMPNFTAVNSFDENDVLTGLLHFNWDGQYDCLDPNAEGVTLDDGTVIFEICFTALGSYGATTDVAIPSDPAPFSLRNNTNCTNIGFLTQGTIISNCVRPFRITASSETGNTGDLVCVDFVVSGFDNMRSMQFSVNWDSTILAIQSVIPNDDIANNGNIYGFGGNIPANAMTVSWSYFIPNEPGISLEDGTTFFQACFEIIGSCETSSEISFTGTPTPIEVTNAEEEGFNFVFVPEDGDVTVNDCDPPGLVLIADCGDPVNINDQICVEVTVGDNFQDITDLSYLMKWNSNILEFDNITGINPSLNANFDPDASNAANGFLAINWENGATPALDLPANTVLYEVCFNVIGLGGNSPIAFSEPAIVRMNNGPNIGINPSNCQVVVNQPDGVAMNLSAGAAAPGEETCIQVAVSNFENIEGYQFSLTWDPLLIQFTEVTNISIPETTMDNFFFNNDSGSFFFDWEPSQSYTFPDGQVIFELCYTPIGDPLECSDIIMVDLPLVSEAISESSNGENIGINANTGEVCILYPEGFGLYISDAEGDRLDTTCVEIGVVAFEDITTAQLGISWDPTLFEFVGFNNNNNWLADTDVLTGNAGVGLLTIDWNDAAGLTLADSTVFMELCFALPDTARACFDVEVVPDPAPVVTTLNGDGSLFFENGEICINDRYIITDTIITPVSCPGACDGRIEIVVTGGDGAVGTIWLTEPNQFTPFEARNLCEGPVEVDIFDQANPSMIERFTFNIPVNDTIPVADAGPDTMQLNCNPPLTLLSGSGSEGPEYSYEWSRYAVANDDWVGGISDDSFATVENPGTYRFEVTFDNTGCTIMDTIEVIAPTTPEVDAGDDQIITCVAGSDTLTLGGNGSSTGTNIAYEWMALDTGMIVSGEDTLAFPRVVGPGAYQLNVSFLSTGCAASDTVVVTDGRVFPRANGGPDLILGCDGVPVTFDASPSENNGLDVIYEWTDAEGLVLAEGITFTTSDLGTYTLVVTEQNTQCQAVDMVTAIPSDEFPTVTIDSAATFTCNVDTVMLTASVLPDTANYTFSWISPDGGQFVPGTESTLALSATAGGTFILRATNEQNCTGLDTVVVAVDTIPPVAEAGEPFTLSCDGTAQTLDGTGSATGAPGAFSYYWINTSGEESDTVGVDVLMVDINTPGVYYLEVIDNERGCIGVDSVDIGIAEQPPGINLADEQSITCLQDTITLSATVTPAGDYVVAWTTVAGEGNIIGASTDVLEIMTDAASIYTLTVTDPATNCVAVAEVLVIDERAGPLTEAGPDQVLGCTDDFVTLDGSGSANGPNVVYAWSVTPDPGDVATVDVFAAGVYYLTLTDNTTGCTAVDSVAVTADTDAPVLSIADFGMLDCENDCIALDASASSPTTDILISWVGLDGGIPSPDDSLVAEVCQPGRYEVTLQNIANGCTTVDTVTVEANIDAPVINFTEPDIFSCTSASVTIDASATGDPGTFSSISWTALSGGGTISPPTGSLVVTVDMAGDYELTVINANNGCSATQVITVTPDTDTPVADAGADFEIGCGESSSLDGTLSSQGAEFTYAWSALDGVASPSPEDVLEPTISEAGTYVLNVMNAGNGCADTDTVVVALDLPDAADAGVDQAICEDSIQLTANLPQGVTGMWTTSSGSNIINPTAASTLVTGLDGGTNTFTWTLSASGCGEYSSDEVVVSLGVEPTVNDDLLEIGADARSGSINLLANDLPGTANIEVNLLTQPLIGTIDSFVNNVVYFSAPQGANGTTTVQYEVCALDCGRVCATANLIIVIDEDGFEPEIPNTITPNGDGLNDTFIFDDLLLGKPEDFPDNHFIVFNRWGDIVYEIRPYNNNWAGTNNQGEDLPEGTYYYILRLNIADGNIYRGDVTIVK